MMRARMAMQGMLVRPSLKARGTTCSVDVAVDNAADDDGGGTIIVWVLHDAF